MTSVQSQTIRVADLRSPRLTEIQRDALSFAAQNPATLTVDAVLETASRRTGLTDFGSADFTERLAVWLGEYSHDPNRTALGGAMAFRLCARYATARLQLQHLIAQHPEVEDEPIQAPIIVIGLPRSGTTHLLNALAADDRFQSLPLWESYEPVRPSRGQDHRYDRTLKEHERGQALLPHQQAMHPMSPNHIHEEIELQGPDFSSYTFEWFASCAPHWRDYYLAHDQTRHYAYMRKTLQAIQWQRGDRRRWILKSPQHLEQLGPLLTVFPDAAIVVTHRDPVSVVQSAATMLAYAARLHSKTVDSTAIFGYWTDRIEGLLRSLVRDRHLLDYRPLIDIAFKDFMNDQLGAVEAIYRIAGMEFETQRDTTVAYLDSHPRGGAGRIEYDVRADFGADPGQLHRRFSFYTDRFEIRREVQ